MQSQAERDAKTLAITTALALFVLVLVAGWVALWLADSAFGFDQAVMDALFPVVCGLSILAGIGYLLRDSRASRARRTGK